MNQWQVPGFAMPLIGWGMLSAGGYPVRVADELVLRAILPHDLKLYAVLRVIHTIVALLFFALIIAHLAATLMHGLIRRDGVLRSMTIGHRPAPLQQWTIDGAEGQRTNTS